MTYIKEVILENFMSYRYSRISLEKGLNIITGPNGSGKSSILLGISVALGQTYTERGRRLGDLVRKGEDIARVTVVFDNSRKDGKKPFPWFRTDEVYFTRYVRRDGEYWHEVNGRVTPKVEVIRYLSRVGINPNNMMIIMHQNMIEQFIYLSPQEKLKTVEDVMGLRIYRERIVSSLEDLKNIQKEEKVLKGSLENAREQFEYWNTLYSKYLKKLELEEKLKNLTAEKYWRLVHEKRLELDKINKKLKGLEDRIKNIRDKIEKETLYKNRILEEITDIENEILLRNKNLERLLNNLRVKWMEYADKHAEISQDNVILSYMIKELKEMKKENKRIRDRINELVSKAKEYGEVKQTLRDIAYIEEEIKKTELEIASLGEIPSNVTEVYNKYKEIFEEYSRRVEKLSENKEILLKELEKRISLWQNKVTSLVEKLQENFARYLNKISAVGKIELINMEDISNSGLVLYVGFRGSPLSVLDAYTHSGGEKTSTVMCFFLSLQDYIKSPIRAIDEFDVHMDPRNRKILLSLLFKISEENPETQFIIITPGILDYVPENSNVLIVQKTMSVSELYKYR